VNWFLGVGTEESHCEDRGEGRGYIGLLCVGVVVLGGSDNLELGMNVAAGLGGKESSAAVGSCLLLDGLFIFLLAERATLIPHQPVFSPPRCEFVRLR
jgi:hypothetical protein